MRNGCREGGLPSAKHRFCKGRFFSLRRTARESRAGPARSFLSLCPRGERCWRRRQSFRAGWGFGRRECATCPMACTPASVLPLPTTFTGCAKSSERADSSTCCMPMPFFLGLPSAVILTEVFDGYFVSHTPNEKPNSPPERGVYCGYRRDKVTRIITPTASLQPSLRTLYFVRLGGWRCSSGRPGRGRVRRARLKADINRGISTGKQSFCPLDKAPLSKSAPRAFWASIILSTSSMRMGIKRRAMLIIMARSWTGTLMSFKGRHKAFHAVGEVHGRCGEGEKGGAY